MDSDFSISDLIGDLDDQTRHELASKPEVDKNWTGTLDVASLPITARRWVEVPDLVAVVSDMKNSTKMGTGKHAASTASIYQASTGGIVQVFNKLEADFLQIQGDGVFALFWGDKRHERAMCAAITAQTFGGKLTDRLRKKWPDAPETGLKVGVASSRILVKRIGTPRNPSQQEPVWAGKAVNYATKAAQSAEAHQVIITGTVWDMIESNDYLTVSCGCGSNGVGSQLWVDTEISRLPDDDPDVSGRMLKAPWCAVHGDDFCNQILAGKTIRPEVAEQRKSALQSQFQTALRTMNASKRRSARERRTGLGER